MKSCYVGGRDDTWPKRALASLRKVRRTFPAIVSWLRVEHRGAPRWILGFGILFAGVLAGVLAASWGT